MSTIFYKTGVNLPNSGCLILDPRERFLYPFDVGQWSEIRVGAYYSFVPATGNDITIWNDQYTGPYYGISKMFYGFCNYNTGTLSLPGMSGGYDFVGNAYGINQNNLGVSVSDTTNSRINGGNSNNDMDVWVYDTTGYKSGVNNSNNSVTLNMPTAAGTNPNFAAFCGWQLGLSGVAFSLKPFTNSTTYTSDTSYQALRRDIASMGTTKAENLTTGFFTSGQNPNLPNLMVPNAFMFFNPMLNSRMRIHSILVEKYA